MKTPAVQVDYGTLTPQDADRFGVHHYARLSTRHHTREFLDANPKGAIKRLGLRLSGWYLSWQNVHVYALEIHQRPLEIRRYSDGRIKLFLDGQPVYTENIKVVTRHGVRHRETEVWRDPALAEEEAEAAAQNAPRRDLRRAEDPTEGEHLMPEFIDGEARQIFIAHKGLWQQLERWAEARNFYLHRIPDGANEDGVPFFSDDPETTPTYAFMPRES